MRPAPTIRGAVAEGLDAQRLDRLAALAGCRPPEGAVLLAEVGGEPVGAIGIFDGHAIYDPRRSTFALRARMWLLRLQLRVIVTVCGV